MRERKGQGKEHQSWDLKKCWIEGKERMREWDEKEEEEKMRERENYGGK